MVQKNIVVLPLANRFTENERMRKLATRSASSDEWSFTRPDEADRSREFAARLEQAWSIRKNQGPVACEECMAQGCIECKWCRGTGYFIVGDSLLCSVSSRSSSCVICGGKGTICDFGYSKSSLLHSQPKSTVGTPAYIAPEVLSKKEYDGKTADVWSCGVTLYVMLVGAYPFEDPDDPRNFRKTIGRIMSVQYHVPPYVRLSPECKHLLSRIFTANPTKRITMPEIKRHPWFLRNLPADLMHENDPGYQYDDPNHPPQSIEEIMRILQEARVPGIAQPSGDGYLNDDRDDERDDEDMDNDMDDFEGSGEFVNAL
ncbi:unnamed protein product [Closterium sp. Naga37s-1]|nr:unnamed protein product [Closterium sp. Naga37s-1]